MGFGERGDPASATKSRGASPRTVTCPGWRFQVGSVGRGGSLLSPFGDPGGVLTTLEATQRQILSQISHRCHPILEAFVWELTTEVAELPVRRIVWPSQGGGRSAP